MPAYTSPDVRNITVGAGELYFKPAGAGSYIHLGNVPQFQFNLKRRVLDHFAPVEGIKVKDFSWTVEMTAEIQVIMEEVTAINLQMLMLGTVSGAQVFITAHNPPVGALRYVSNNEIGPRWNIDLYAVTFTDDGDFDPLTTKKNDFEKITLKGSALAVNGSFGVMTRTN